MRSSWSRASRPDGAPFEGKLYPNGIYRAMYGPLPHGSDVND
jgi:hypothetical protein